MRKWINFGFFVLVLLAAGVVFLERQAVKSSMPTQEIVIEVKNVLDR